MATTLEAFAGSTRRNYCTLPAIDVEILPDVRHCETCEALVTFDQSVGIFGAWVHTSADTPDHGHVAPKTRCSYCHGEDDATYVQHAWFDAIECARCGGVDGHAIGD
ncbi:hypothetical protein [Candidatus Mycobacterium methanotrophicum]|uniref:Uncharacterized protein n=1 Tax=Candidatus Mycobacterium methanotrophicum TaxID=2943498 RepID=A0ABY4QS90_9MYCO|nr:hypothetical protein [Candidatus Mycobacterium methanotrophicum]UQX13397.1 hypothetical protein M5I08_24605 [Candidatus Mycobacterium methanotrophicum]